MKRLAPFAFALAVASIGTPLGVRAETGSGPAVVPVRPVTFVQVDLRAGLDRQRESENGIAALDARLLARTPVEAGGVSLPLQEAIRAEGGDLSVHVHDDRVAVELAGDMARRLLAEIPATLRTEGWLEKVEQYLAALPGRERQGLALQLAGGAPVRVVSASPLPESARELWRERLGRALRCDLTVELTADPGLIAGVQVNFPAAVLELSWRSQLAALRSQDAPAGERAHADAR